MIDESIQEGAPVVPLRGPVTSDDGPASPFSSVTREKDKQHLKTLSIFYFILAGMSVLGAVMGLILIPIGAWLASTVDTRQGGLPPEFGYFFIGLGIFLLLWRAVYAYLMFHAGKSLRQQKRWQFIFIMAIVDCVLGGVVGIVLGVFTIIVLNRPSVKELFAEGDSPYPKNEDA